LPDFQWARSEKYALMATTEHWYGIKVFYNRVKFIKEKLDAEGITTYVAMKRDGTPLIASLMFVHCSLPVVQRIKVENNDYLFVYTRKAHSQQTLVNISTGASVTVNSDYESNIPSAISDDEMQAFMIVANSGIDTLQYLGDDDPRYHVGAKVRVLKGPLKGAVGYIKRIKKDRKFIVCVSGIAAIATMHINPEDLASVEDVE
jgi:transcription antitermination factor NusG